MPSANRPLRSRLEDHYDELVSELRPRYYIDFLFARRVLSRADREELDQMGKTPMAQAKHFVNILLESRIRTFLKNRIR